jgi:vesicle trafficking docking Arf3-like protein
MEHQYPAPIGGDESMLAELMLPDQTHVRSQDWTIFFLHKDTGTGEEEESQDTNKTGKKKKKKYKESNGSTDEEDDGTTQPFASDEEASDEEDVSGEGPPLMYVLNLVNTKQDNNFRRYVFPIPVRHIILT